MMIFVAPSYESSLKKLTKNNPQLKIKINARIYQFKSNPLHPGLKLHKLTGGLHDKWSFSITDDVRLTFMYVEDGIIFVKIGKHKDVY